jgi:hypothetical protein
MTNLRGPALAQPRCLGTFCLRNQFIENSVRLDFWEGAASVTRGARGLCFVKDSRERVSSVRTAAAR